MSCKFEDLLLFLTRGVVTLCENVCLGKKLDAYTYSIGLNALLSEVILSKFDYTSLSMVNERKYSRHVVNVHHRQCLH